VNLEQTKKEGAAPLTGISVRRRIARISVMRQRHAAERLLREPTAYVTLGRNRNCRRVCLVNIRRARRRAKFQRNGSLVRLEDICPVSIRSEITG
jgi:hypothetical protein